MRKGKKSKWVQMPLAYNEKTGEVLVYRDRKFVSKEEAEEMFPKEPSGELTPFTEVLADAVRHGIDTWRENLKNEFTE